MKFAWAVSGRGTTLRAVIEAQAAGILESTTELIIVDRPSPIESFASARGICLSRIEPTGNDTGGFQSRIRDELVRSNADWLCLTFNRLLSPVVLASVAHRVLSLHMSLLPSFPGFGAIAKAISSGVRISGVTVHLVDTGMDSGPILGQSACRVLPSDTTETLGRKLFELAVPLMLQILRSIETHQVSFDGACQPVWRFNHSVETGGCTFPTVDPDVLEFCESFFANRVQSAP